MDNHEIDLIDLSADYVRPQENVNNENVYIKRPDVDSVSLDSNVENDFIGLGSYEEEKPLITLEQQTVMNSMNKYENKRVLLMNTVAGTGSVGRLVTGLYDALSQRGYECLIAFGRDEAPKGYNCYRIGTDFDVYVHGAMSRLNDKHGFYSKRATKEFIDVIEDFDPDIIHIHNVHGYYLNIEVFFKYLKYTDTFLHMHTHKADYFIIQKSKIQLSMFNDILYFLISKIRVMLLKEIYVTFFSHSII